MAYQFDSGQAHQIGRRKNILISAPTLLIKYLVQGTSRTMITLFKKKWNPLKDESYMNFYNKYSKLKILYRKA